MLIAQITDLHVEPGMNAKGNTVEITQRAVKHLNLLKPRPDAVVVTGDLVAEERLGHYQAIATALNRLECPYYVLPGNHDDRELLREVFREADYLPTTGEFLHYTVEEFELRLVVLDTHDPGESSGLLCQARLEWLKECLAESPSRPTLIAMHHPPIETGIWEFDNIGLKGREAFGETISQNPQVQAIACGHVHRDVVASWCGTLVAVTPSTGYQYALRLGQVKGFKRIAEPAVCRLFWWMQDVGMVSHISYITS